MMLFSLSVSPSICVSVPFFLPKAYAMVSMVIAQVDLLIHWSLFKYLVNRSLVFPETLREVKST